MHWMSVPSLKTSLLCQGCTGLPPRFNVSKTNQRLPKPKNPWSSDLTWRTVFYVPHILLIRIQSSIILANQITKHVPDFFKLISKIESGGNSRWATPATKNTMLHDLHMLPCARHCDLRGAWKFTKTWNFCWRKKTSSPWLLVAPRSSPCSRSHLQQSAIPSKKNCKCLQSVMSC